MNTSTLINKVNSDPELQRRGKFYSTSFAIKAGEDVINFVIEEGQLENISDKPDEQVDFSFKGSQATWDKFLAGEPEPGFHDLSAMIDQQHLNLEGDPRLWLYNTLYIKRLVQIWKEASKT